MLVQSRGGEIIFLPALPKQWADGKVSGLRVRGGAELDLGLKGGAASTATLRPTVAGSFKLRFAPNVRVKAIREAGKPVKVTPAADKTVPLNVKAGSVYTIEFEPAA
jgi:alpha-L-fucosidase 2